MEREGEVRAHRAPAEAARGDPDLRTSANQPPPAASCGPASMSQGLGFGTALGATTPSWTGSASKPRPMEMPSHVLFGSWVPSAMMSDACLISEMMLWIVGAMALIRGYLLESNKKDEG